MFNLYETLAQLQRLPQQHLKKLAKICEEHGKNS